MKATLIAAIGLVMASAHGVSIAATPYEFAPPASWVDVLPSPQAAPGAGAAPDVPAEFLLVDWQVRLAQRADTYVRTATRVNNPSAIEQHSQLSIAVDPAAEKLVIHGLWIQRGGVAVDQSRRARISALQRETGLEQNVVDGRLTVHVMLEDVRVGDVVDYSYTLSRVDPTGDPRAADVMQRRWTEPVARARLRLLHPGDRSVRLLDLGGGAAPVVRTTAGWVETTWDARDVPAQRYESQRPGWHAFFPRVEYSEFGDWDALRAWAMPLYDVPAAATDPRLAATLEALRRESDPQQRIVDALAFVQEEIRYTGIEIGAGAYRPHAPGVVVERRYGDCKDKTLLFVTLLRATGIDAAPALVNTGMGRGVRDRLPAPGAFDHVIARVRHGGRTWWLDPTRTAQGRRLEVIAQADFGAALVLADGSEGLDTIPGPRVSEPQIDVLERFDLTRGTGVTAGLDVETRYRGASAEAMRARLRDTPASRITEQYQDYYHGRYPGLRSAAPVSVQDDPASNELVLREKYAIDGIFAAGAEEGLETFEVEASTIAEHVAKPENPRRTSPLALAFPLNVRHRIQIALPEPWQVDAGSKRVDGPGFSYQSTIAAKAREISLDYRFETRDDHVLQEDVAEHIASLDKVGDDL